MTWWVHLWCCHPPLSCVFDPVLTTRHGTAAAVVVVAVVVQDPGVMRRGFLPFSEGSRNCVGQALALVELKAVLAMLLGNFSFRWGRTAPSNCC